MSQSRSRSRLIRAGLTVGAVGAALLVAPQAAFAGANVGPSIVQPGGSATIFDPSAPFATVAAVQLSVTSCVSKSVAPAPTGPWTAGLGNKNATSVSFTVPPTAGPTAGPNGTAKPYFACVYDGSVAGSNLLGGGPIFVGTPAMSNPGAGVTGGGNQLTVNANPNAPVFTGVNAVAAVFTTGACAGQFGATNPPNLVAMNVNRMSNTVVSFPVPPGVVSANGPAPTMYNACLYDASSANGPLLTFVPYTVTVVGVSPASGSYLNSTGVTATSPIPFLSGVTMPAVVLLGGNAPCPATYSTAPIGTVTPLAITGPGTVRRLSNLRAAITIPPLPLVNSQPTTYQLCFYANASVSGALLGTSNYTAAVVASPTGVVPAAGPAAGGNMITVVGTDFPADPGRITATLGGAPLTNIQPISSQAFTAQAPAHAVEDNVTLVVSTPAGTKALPGAYSYLNPIKISPNTAPSTAPSVDVDVQGMGFMSINFGSGGNAGRVFLVSGTYNGADAGGGARANGPVAECVNVLPISDEELVCTMQLNRRLNIYGTAFFDSIGYTNLLTSDVSTAAGSRTIVSAGGKFNANDLGQPISQTSNANIPQGTIVTAVLSPTKAVISVPSPATGTTLTATIGNAPVHTFTGALTTTQGSTTVTVSSGAFGQADVGRVFSATPGIPAGTTIVSVTPGGVSATLSAPANQTTGYALPGASIAVSLMRAVASAMLLPFIAVTVSPTRNPAFSPGPPR